MVTSILQPVAAASSTGSSSPAVQENFNLNDSGNSLADIQSSSNSEIPQTTEKASISSSSPSSVIYPEAGPQLNNFSVEIIRPPETGPNTTLENGEGRASVNVRVTGEYKNGTYPWRFPVTVRANSEKLNETSIVTIRPSNSSRDYTGKTSFTFQYNQDTDSPHEVNVNARIQSSGQEASDTEILSVIGQSDSSNVVTDGQIRNDDVSEAPDSVSRVARFKTDDRAENYLEDASIPVGRESNVTNFAEARTVNENYSTLQSFRGDMEIGTLTTGIPNGTSQTLVIQYRALSGDSVNVTPVNGNGEPIDKTYTLPANPLESEYCHAGVLADLCVFRLTEEETRAIGDYKQLSLEYESDTSATTALFCQDVITGAMPRQGTVCGIGGVNDYSEGRIISMSADSTDGSTAESGEIMTVNDGSELSFTVVVENQGNEEVTDTLRFETQDGSYGPVTRSVTLDERESESFTFGGYEVSDRSYTFVSTFGTSRKSITVRSDNPTDEEPPVADAGGPYRVALDRTGRNVSQSGVQQQTLSQLPGSEWELITFNGTKGYDNWFVDAQTVPVIPSIAALESDSTNNVTQINANLQTNYETGVTVNDVYSEELDFARTQLPNTTSADEWSLYDIEYTSKVETQTILDTERPDGYGWERITQQRLVATGEFEYEQFRAQPNTTTEGFNGTETDIEGGEWVLDDSRPSERKLVGYKFNNTTVDPDKYDADTNDSDGRYDWERYQWYGEKEVTSNFSEWEVQYSETRYNPGPEWRYVGRNDGQYEYRKPTYETVNVWTYRMPVYSEYYWYKRPIKENASKWERDIYDAKFEFRRNIDPDSRIAIFQGPEYTYENEYETKDLTLNGSNSQDYGPESIRGIEEYLWNFEDGSTANGETTVKNYGTPFGEYYPELTVYDAARNNDTQNTTVEVIRNETCVGPNCGGEPVPLRPEIEVNAFYNPVDRRTETVWANFNISGTVNEEWKIEVKAPEDQPNLSKEVWRSSTIIDGEEEVNLYVNPREKNIPLGEIDFEINATPVREGGPYVTENFTVDIYEIEDNEPIPPDEEEIGDDDPRCTKDSDKDGIRNCFDPCPYTITTSGFQGESCVFTPESTPISDVLVSWNTSEDYANAISRNHIRYQTLYGDEWSETSGNGISSTNVEQDAFQIGYPVNPHTRQDLIAYYAFDNEYYEENNWSVTDHATRRTPQYNANIYYKSGSDSRNQQFESEGPALKSGGIYGGQGSIGFETGNGWLEIINPRTSNSLDREFENDLTVSFWAQSTEAFSFPATFKDGEHFFTLENARSSPTLTNREGFKWEYGYRAADESTFPGNIRTNFTETWIFTQAATASFSGGTEDIYGAYPSWMTNGEQFDTDKVTSVSNDFKSHKWNHYTYVLRGDTSIDEGEMRIYRNGEEIYSKSSGTIVGKSPDKCLEWFTPIPDSELPDNIGVSPDTCPLDGFWWRLDSPTGTTRTNSFIWGGTWDNNEFTGGITDTNFDEIRVYDTARTESQVRNDLYIDNQGSISLQLKTINKTAVSTDKMNLTVEGTIPGGSTVSVDVIPWEKNADGTNLAMPNKAVTKNFTSESTTISGSSTKKVNLTEVDKLKNFSVDVTLDSDSYTETPRVSNITLSAWNGTTNNTSDNVPPEVFLNKDGGPVKADETVRFIGEGVDPDGTIEEFIYRFGDSSEIISGAASGTEIPPATTQYECAGTYNASLTVLDDGGAFREQATETVEVQVQNEEPVAEIEANKERVSIGETVSFDAFDSEDPDGSLEDYTWTLPDGTQTAGASQTYTFNSEGTYTIGLDVTDNACESDSDSIQIVVENNPPTANAEVNSTVTVVNKSLSFAGSDSFDPDGTITSYTWDFNNDGIPDESGEVSSGSGIPVVENSYEETGNKTAVLTVEDANGKNDTDNVSVEIKPREYSLNTSFGRGTETYNSCRVSDSMDRVNWVDVSKVNNTTVEMTMEYETSETGSYTKENGINIRFSYHDNDSSTWTSIYSDTIKNPRINQNSTVTHTWEIPQEYRDDGVSYIRGSIEDRSSTADSAIVGPCATDDGTSHFDNADHRIELTLQPID